MINKIKQVCFVGFVAKIKLYFTKLTATTAALILVFSPGLAFAVLDTQLDFGDTGAKVTELQTFLKTDPAVYPEGLVTGYFGPLTQAAVQRFQCKYNIVCSGTPTTTGYGRVGPLTLAKISEVMGNGGAGGADINAPVISNVVVSAAQTEATISWMTNENASSKIMYSTSYPFLYATAPSVIDGSMNTVSSVTITGLAPNATYFYALESVDANGNIQRTVPSNSFVTQ